MAILLRKVNGIILQIYLCAVGKFYRLSGAEVDSCVKTEGCNHSVYLLSAICYMACSAFTEKCTCVQKVGKRCSVLWKINSRKVHKLYETPVSKRYSKAREVDFVLACHLRQEMQMLETFYF